MCVCVPVCVCVCVCLCVCVSGFAAGRVFLVCIRVDVDVMRAGVTGRPVCLNVHVRVGAGLCECEHV